ncbi:NtaA/DmoA family FMN-dependent monooxygenase [Rhodococcus sp. YH1]|uniref:NtaA/DmoA family FMN-dependent monooxygenase n=1 Tax=Rhodococcus sp. YH1 TaxID=89066 RepID=UPI0013868586|nr:Nitrilotriacetate monooxygenase component A [Rhodococcus sp. YH1]
MTTLPASGVTTEHLHLNISLLTPGHFRGAWRTVGNNPTDFVDPEHFRRLIRIAERGSLTAVFVGDSPALSGEIGNAPGLGLDPVVMLAHAAAGTSGIGVIATGSSTYNDPYNLARRYLSLDHLTGGRAGWNVVTTQLDSAAANFGYAEVPDKADRYRRADEFVEVVTKLWDGWQPGALIGDRSTGRFADPELIRGAEHHGEYFSVAGALPLPRSPQGRPLIVQAGASEGGLALAGRYADVVFTAAQTVEVAHALRTDLRRRAGAAGRAPDSLRTSTGLITVVGDTEEQARQRERELRETIPLGTALPQLAGQLGLDPATLTLDTVVTAGDLPAPAAGAPRSEGFLTSIRALLSDVPLTARELIHRFAGGAGHRLVVGTAEQIADTIEAWFRAGATDGFTVMPGDVGTGLEAFVDQVVPELVRRGLFRGEYAHTTLRGNLGLEYTRASTVGLAG